MMATYFNGGSEIQSDNLQTLYLMNRGGYAAYSDAGTQPPPGYGGGNALVQHQHHLVGIPLAGDETSGAVLQGQLVPRFHYNLWGGGGGGGEIPTAIAAVGELGFRRPAPVTLAATSSTSTLDHHNHNHHHHQQGGLSLSLNNSSPHKNAAAATPTSASGISSGGPPSVLVGSKFLKAAQQLLDEVVNVGKAIISKPDGMITAKDKAKAAVIWTGDGSDSGTPKGTAADLTTAQRQELQMKKAKLLNMLDEVEQRYRQYHSQMQAVAAGLEQAAGEGSAKAYTALALQTISKQFRCLKDAIMGQIKATGKSMGEEGEDEEEEGKAGRSRLRMVDHQLRQQRALQQLGMMHHNAWRPQRGLPERAVSVLRAWLFEHFLHPYPKDSDKHMLAKQTGLTRSQVSNWFINARVRLWKPMVEEMYVEEMKSQEQNGTDNNNHTTTTTTEDHHNNKEVVDTPKATPPPLGSRHGHHQGGFNQNPHQDLLAPNDVVSNPNMLSPPSSSNNGPGLHGFSLVEMDPMMQGDHHQRRSPTKKPRVMVNSDVGPTTNILTAGFGSSSSYPMGEIGSRQFNPDHHHHHQQQQYRQGGNAVALTLGLPHDCDQQSYFPGQAVHLTPAPSAYDEMNVDVQNRKRFAAQLLPDYVT